MLDVLAQYRGELALPGDQELVEAFAAQCPDEPLARTVPMRCSLIFRSSAGRSGNVAVYRSVNIATICLYRFEI
jgi:hypothetical protein